MKNIREFSFHRELSVDSVESTIELLEEIPSEYRKPIVDSLLLDKIDMITDALSTGEIVEGIEFIVQDLFTEEEWKYFKHFPGRMALGRSFHHLVNNNDLPFEKVSTDWPSKYVTRRINSDLDKQ